jgi:hypothetical protein
MVRQSYRFLDVLQQDLPTDEPPGIFLNAASLQSADSMPLNPIAAS